MFLSIIKKEFLQFFRSKSNVLLLMLFPIILITTLSVGLKNMLSGDNNIFGSGDEYSTVYYSITDDNSYSESFDTFISEVEDNINVKFEKVTSLSEVQEDVNNYTALLHVNITSDGFELYSSKKGETTKIKIIKSLFTTLLNQYASYNTIYENNPEALQNLIDNTFDEYVTKGDIGNVRQLNSSEYYTFAELGLIILYISTVVGESVYNENNLTTINRLRLSKLSESMILSSKIIVGVSISIMQTLLIYAYSSIILHVEWGINTLKFMYLFIALGLFSSVLGAVVGILSKKFSSVNGILNAIIIVICFFGGCYTPLRMITQIPFINKLIVISPIYWLNTAISSVLCEIPSNAYTISLIFPIASSIIGLILYCLISRKKGGLVND